MIGFAVLVLALNGPQKASDLSSSAVGSPDAACSRAIEVYAAAFVPPLGTTYCDHIQHEASPPGFYVLALRSGRKCEGICSDLMGWFGVERSTGTVYDWDVAENQPGDPIMPRGLKSGDGSGPVR